MMIYLYWPKKAVPSWLESIEPTSKDSVIGEFRHAGFGVVVRVRKNFIVWGAFGCFIKISNAVSVRLRGAPITGGYVVYTSSVCQFIKVLRKGVE